MTLVFSYFLKLLKIIITDSLELSEIPDVR